MINVFGILYSTKISLTIKREYFQLVIFVKYTTNRINVRKNKNHHVVTKIGDTMILTIYFENSSKKKPWSDCGGLKSLALCEVNQF